MHTRIGRAHTVVGVAILGLLVFSLVGSATAAEKDPSNVFVVNDSTNPVPAQLVGIPTVNIGNTPSVDVGTPTVNLATGTVVEVGNTSPIPVEMAAPAAPEIVQERVIISFEPGTSQIAGAELYVVPEGKIFHLEYANVAINAHAGGVSGSLEMRFGPGLPDTIALAFDEVGISSGSIRNQLVVDQQLDAYAEPGTIVRGHFFRESSEGTLTLNLTLVGELLPAS